MRPAVLVLIILAGCQDAPTPKAKVAARVAAVEVSDAEAVELAKAYVLNNHVGAKILKVGPNLGRKDMAALRREAGVDEQGAYTENKMAAIFAGMKLPIPKLGFDGDSLVRIRFLAKDPMAIYLVDPKKEEAPPKVFDCIFVVRRKIIIGNAFNGSDDWVPAYRGEMAKSFPGIKVR